MQFSQAEIETTKFSTKPLLRPRQVEALTGEMKVMEAQLNNPIVQNKGQIQKQLATLTRNYREQVPHTPAAGSTEEAKMIARSKYLLEKIVPAMCSQEEMRKAPPGAVDKFMKQENSPEIKPMIAEWQNLQLRLHPGEHEAANIERHRPKTSTLNMDNAIVSTKTYIMPENTSGIAVTFSDEQLALLRLVDPAVADKLATMPNDLRAQIKDLIETESKPKKETAAGLGLNVPSKKVAAKKTKKKSKTKKHKVAKDTVTKQV